MYTGSTSSINAASHHTATLGFTYLVPAIAQWRKALPVGVRGESAPRWDDSHNITTTCRRSEKHDDLNRVRELTVSICTYPRRLE
jgi:hypothetical protein